MKVIKILLCVVFIAAGMGTAAGQPYAVSQDGDQNDVTTLVKHYEKRCGIEIAGAAAGKQKS